MSGDPPLRPELRPVLGAGERAELIERGVALFNAGRFYDCHEAWETVWRSTTPEPRDLWRGLIQVAVGFYHFHDRRRPDVAARVLRKGAGRVEPFAPSGEGLDLAALLATVDAWVESLESGSAPRPGAPRLERIRRGGAS
ncbi:MAG: DUF309 domain-containing protein [Acidobacteriota bacterium]